MDYLILLSSIVLGAATVFFLRLDAPRHIKLVNAFTGAFLLSLTLLHLLPELYHGHENASPVNPLLIGGLMLVGFFVQVALDVISMGVEHGHSHHLPGRMPVGVLAGLCLHAFVEALALGDARTHFDPNSRQMLLASIVVHNFPVSIALLGMLLQSGMRRSTALWLLALFAAMGPLGMFLSSHTELAHHSRALMAVVIGIFMHISTTILFEASDVHRFNFAKLAAIIAGTALGVAGVLWHS
ncbi:MAG: zinc/iron permease [Pedosphaera sp.]|nr:zinc/iron permease [Pedosphaera sp.]